MYIHPFMCESPYVGGRVDRGEGNATRRPPCPLSTHNGSHSCWGLRLPAARGPLPWGGTEGPTTDLARRAPLYSTPSIGHGPKRIHDRRAESAYWAFDQSFSVSSPG